MRFGVSVPFWTPSAAMVCAEPDPRGWDVHQFSTNSHRCEQSFVLRQRDDGSGRCALGSAPTRSPAAARGHAFGSSGGPQMGTGKRRARVAFGSDLRAGGEAFMRSKAIIPMMPLSTIVI